MKNLLLFLSVLLITISCNPNDVPDTKGKLDPNAMIVIKPAKGVQLRSTVSGLTALEVVEQARAIRWQSHWFGNTYWDDAKDIARGFPDQYKDFEMPALKMLGTDIIAQFGEYYKDFIYGYNVFITDNNLDTIAYVPDDVINSARPLIEAAYADSNYTEVYRLFNEAFTFLPVK